MRRPARRRPDPARGEKPSVAARRAASSGSAQGVSTTPTALHSPKCHHAMGSVAQGRRERGSQREGRRARPPVQSEPRPSPGAFPRAAAPPPRASPTAHEQGRGRRPREGQQPEGGCVGELHPDRTERATDWRGSSSSRASASKRVRVGPPARLERSRCARAPRARVAATAPAEPSPRAPARAPRGAPERPPPARGTYAASASATSGPSTRRPRPVARTAARSGSRRRAASNATWFRSPRAGGACRCA